MKTVAIVALKNVVSFDLALATETFHLATLENGKAAYKVQVCGPNQHVKTSLFDLKLRHDLNAIEHADTVVVPGLCNFDTPIHADVLIALRRAFERKKRIVSICSGAFILAEAGLLDRKRATTHWFGAAELQRRYPLIQVDPNVLYVQSGRIFTSAGASAGLDLCLHLIRLDYGVKVAAQAARLAVVPLERSGGQAQFILHEPPTSAGSLEKVLTWMEKNFAEPLTTEQIAARANMSLRTLARKFKDQTGTTPLQWLLKLRIRKSQAMLESSAHSVDEISNCVGFGNVVSFREHFRKQTGVNPKRYRESFQAGRLKRRR